MREGLRTERRVSPRAVVRGGWRVTSKADRAPVVYEPHPASPAQAPDPGLRTRFRPPRGSPDTERAVVSGE